MRFSLDEASWVAGPGGFASNWPLVAVVCSSRLPAGGIATARAMALKSLPSDLVVLMRLVAVLLCTGVFLCCFGVGFFTPMS